MLVDYDSEDEDGNQRSGRIKEKMRRGRWLRVMALKLKLWAALTNQQLITPLISLTMQKKELIDLTGDMMLEEVNVNHTASNFNYSDCQKSAEELANLKTGVGELKTKMLKMERKMGSMSRFNLHVMHSFATSPCLKRRVLGEDGDDKGNYKDLFKFLTDDWSHVLYQSGCDIKSPHHV